MDLARLKAVLALFDNVTVSVPTAGLAKGGAARNASYDCVRRGELPVLKFGRRLEVPTAPIREALGLTSKTDFLRVLGLANEAELARMLEQLEQTSTPSARADGNSSNHAPCAEVPARRKKIRG